LERRSALQGWTKRRITRAAVWGAKLQGGLRRHWNNRKYGAVKTKYPHVRKKVSENPPPFGQRPQKGSTALLSEKSLKNIGLKECQIISLPGVRNHETSRGVQMSRVGFLNSQEETGNTHDKFVPLSG